MFVEDDMAARYRIDPATPEEIDWIAQLESEAYSPKDAIPKHILKQWYAANPSGFSIIKTDEQKIGHIDILPLRSPALELFYSGEIMEREIPGDGLHEPGERNSIRSLYIESVIIQPLNGHSNVPPYALLSLLRHFNMLVNRICNPGNVEYVYAMAASKSGARLIQHLGFEQVKVDRARADGHDLYETKFVDLAASIRELCD